MNPFRLRQFVDSTGAELVCGSPDTELTGVGTDTRALRGGELFLALDGPNFRGNDFAGCARRAGAGALCLRAEGAEGIESLRSDDGLASTPVVAHPDPRRALGDFAAWHRSRLAARVVGITGSCGKTTTKSIVVQLLEPLLRTVGSPRSFNNDIGVPLTLLGADEETEALICEIGTNRPGEIAGLCRVSRPDAGVITNVGASHLEGLGSLEGVAHEKADLVRGLSPEGFAVLNADCRFTRRMREETSARVITFSVDGDGDLDARDVLFHPGGSVLRLNGHQVAFPLLGTHNVQNLLAAVGVCTGLGVPLEEVLPLIGSLSGGRQRLERLELPGVSVIDDSYNANPESTRAAVRVLAGLHGAERRVLVLGEMLELGDGARELHREVGREVAGARIDVLVGVGALARDAVDGAVAAGLDARSAYHFDTVDELGRAQGEVLRDGDLVLVKGSRGTRLERFVEALRRERTAAAAPRRADERAGVAG